MKTSSAVRAAHVLKTLGLACMASFASTVPAAAVVQGPYSLEVLVDSRPLSELAGNGRRYIEAIAGKEYSLRLTNNTECRVGIAVSVDGLNSIDAKTTTAKSGSKWVLGPYESIVLDGWQTSSALARSFYFTSEAKSYGAWLGKTDNLGVIAAVVFREEGCDARRQLLMQRESPLPNARGKAESGGFEGAPPVPPPAAAQAPAAPGGRDSSSVMAPKPSGGAAADDYAATGIGREVGHEVERVQLPIEKSAAASMELRYEYRPALVKLGLLPRVPSRDPLGRREQAQGFDSGFAPDPYRPKDWR